MTRTPPQAVEHAASTWAVDSLRSLAATQPDKPALVFLADGERETERASFLQLDARSMALAARLQADGAIGQRVLLMLHSSIDYAVGVLACMYAGAVPVPAYPPGSALHARRVERIVQDCDATRVLTHSRLLPALRSRFEAGSPLARAVWLAVDAVDPAQADDWTPGTASMEVPALLQYTSGSTQDPKGVMVTHANLLRHAQVLQAQWRLTRDDVLVTWLPLFHDMGLIGGLLHPLWMGATVVMMPPAAFIQRPLRWLEAISRYRGSITYAPDFAYAACAAAGSDAEISALDLSCLRVACNAAEPVQATTLTRFARRFAPSRFAPQALSPSYGLAEATLIVTATPQPSTSTAEGLRVDAAALQEGLLRVSVDAGTRSRVLQHSGVGLKDVDVLIVDAQTRQPCTEGRVGEIWLAGPTVAAGYWGRPEATDQTFNARLADGRGPYLRTGDLGAWHDGNLYVTGRLKDLIIMRGQNHHPSDIEHTATMAHEALEPGRATAFSIDGEAGEELVLVAELRRTHRKRADGQQVAQRVASVIAQEHGLRLHGLVLLRPASLPITSSGKVQRQACRRAYLESALDSLHEWQADELYGDTAQAPQAPQSPSDERALLMDALFKSTMQVLRLDEAGIVQLREEFNNCRLSTLGVESLSGLELCRLLQTRCGVDVPLQDLLGSYTADELVDRMQVQRRIQLVVAASHAGEATESETWTI